MDYLRTPEDRFEHLSDFPYKPHELQNGELRMCYIDERTGDGSDEEVFLCLHGEPTWSYLYRKMIPVLLNYTTDNSKNPSRRVVAPDFFGFGRSDKPREGSVYNFDFHRDSLLHLIKTLQLSNITLVVQDWGGVIGLTLPISDPSLFTRLIVMNTSIGGGAAKRSPQILKWIEFISTAQNLDAAALMGKLGHQMSEDDKRAYRAPFPDDSYTAGMRRFPQMIMIDDDAPGMDISKQSRHFYQTTDTFKQKDVFVACGMGDPVMGPRMKTLAGLFKHGSCYSEIEGANHFVQEWGDQVAKLAIQVFEGQTGIEGVQQIEREST